MKTATAPKNIDDYICAFPIEIQGKLNQMRTIIQKAAPSALETISYGIPSYKLNGNLVHFGGFKNHVGFYPGPSGIIKFGKELSGYKGAKGTVQFAFDKPLPSALIMKIVKFRVNENLMKTQKKAS